MKKLQSLGFALCEVKELFESNDYKTYEEKINAKISELDEKIAEGAFCVFNNIHFFRIKGMQRFTFLQYSTYS